MGGAESSAKIERNLHSCVAPTKNDGVLNILFVILTLSTDLSDVKKKLS